MVQKRIGKPLLGVLILSFLLTGCWNRQEINEIGFAVGLGVDKAEKLYQVTTQLALPAKLAEGGGGGEEPPVWVVSGQGKTIFEAIRDINTRSPRKPFWGHLNVIVIGEEAAKDGIIPFIDLFSRGHEFRRLNQIVVAKGKAREVLEAQPKLENITAVFLNRLVENRGGQSVAPGVNVNDLLITLSTPGIDPFLPKIEAREKEVHIKEPPQKEEEQKAGGGEGKKPGEKKEEKPKEILELRGGAAFRGDKFAGWLNEVETRGLLWATGGVGSGILAVESPWQKDKFVSLEIKGAQGEIVPQLAANKPGALIKVKASLNLVEQQDSRFLEDPRSLQRLQELAANEIKGEIMKGVEKARTLQSDIFGFEGKFYKEDYNSWKKIDWKQKWQELQVNYQVDTVIETSSMAIRPVKLSSEVAR
ncbi:MAG: Germination protein Ger(X)C family [Peptococcaceae bacterium]|jgi:spore germination protein KC|nr:Germination protein Ger(X)C family [Peptococcaceae bacterium]